MIIMIVLCDEGWGTGSPFDNGVLNLISGIQIGLLGNPCRVDRGAGTDPLSTSSGHAGSGNPMARSGCSGHV